MASSSIVDQGLMAARLLTALPRFLRQPPPSAEASRAALEQSLRERSRVSSNSCAVPSSSTPEVPICPCCARPESRTTCSRVWLASTGSKRRSGGSTMRGFTSHWMSSKGDGPSVVAIPSCRRRGGHSTTPCPSGTSNRGPAARAAPAVDSASTWEARARRALRPVVPGHVRPRRPAGSAVASCAARSGGNSVGHPLCPVGPSR